MFLDEDFLLDILTALANLNSECHWQKTSPVAPGFPLAAENCSNQRCAGYCHVVIWPCSFQIPYFIFEGIYEFVTRKNQ